MFANHLCLMYQDYRRETIKRKEKQHKRLYFETKQTHKCTKKTITDQLYYSIALIRQLYSRNYLLYYMVDSHV
jgi:hypothetical protein